MTNKRALHYLTQRGVTREQIETFRWGYFPEDQWPPYVSPDDTDADVQAYLKWSRRGFKLRDSLILPVYTASGELCGIHTRSPSFEKKDYSKFYLGWSQREAVYLGNPHAMSSIWETGDIHITEGTFDFFVLQRHVQGTICPLTARVSQRQREFLHRYGSRLFLWLDQDAQGQALAEELERDKKPGQEVINLLYPAKDLAAFWQAEGDARFASFIDQQCRLAL